LTKENYKLIAIGFGVMILGYILMIGGGSDDPNVFREDALFSFQRITLAPILIVGGFLFEIYAIMKRPKEGKQ
jgi:membrane-bound ClpP family serine protease